MREADVIRQFGPLKADGKPFPEFKTWREVCLETYQSARQSHLWPLILSWPVFDDEDRAYFQMLDEQGRA